MKRISVLLAEICRVLREALQQVVKGERDARVVGTVGNGTDALREAERLSPLVDSCAGPVKYAIRHGLATLD